jgi:hypothetical protein
MSGRRYTWVNSLTKPTYEKLDRILVLIEWELNHPLSTVVPLSRVISNHTPLFIDSGKSLPSNKAPMFKLDWVGYLY